jgi:hypothetical protein
MKSIVAVLSLIVLCSCALPAHVYSKPVTLPSGKQGYLVACNGTRNTIAECIEEAAKVCPKGYNIIQQNAEGGTVGTYNAAAGTGMLVPLMKRNMIISCR